MALYDREMQFSDNQTAASGTVVGTDVYDTGLPAGANLNQNRELQILAEVETAFAGGTSINAQFVESDNADLSSPDVLLESGDVALADLSAQARLLQGPVPRTSKRYVGIQYVVTGTMSAGGISAGIVRDIQTEEFLPQNTGQVA